MPIFIKITLIALSVLLVSLFGTTVCGASNQPPQSQLAQVYSVSQENRILGDPGAKAGDNHANNGVVSDYSGSDSDQDAFGDGRSGFWIVGIIVNLSVLGWFLTWAVKEWRKKSD